MALSFLSTSANREDALVTEAVPKPTVLANNHSDPPTMKWLSVNELATSNREKANRDLWEFQAPTPALSQMLPIALFHATCTSTSSANSIPTLQLVLSDTITHFPLMVGLRF